MKSLILQAFQEHLKILPWHTKSILIINFSFLKMPTNAVFWRDFRHLHPVDLIIVVAKSTLAKTAREILDVEKLRNDYNALKS